MRLALVTGGSRYSSHRNMPHSWASDAGVRRALRCTRPCSL